jgi:N-acetylmuramoyl-L-alanine amidase
MNPLEYEIILLALLMWREARGQVFPAQLAVGCSVRNRVNNPGWWGKDWISVILCGDQYSSFNKGDVNSTLFPQEKDMLLFRRIILAAEDIINGYQPDTVQGAQSYFDRSLDSNPPKWAAEMVHVCDIGDFHFYKTR